MDLTLLSLSIKVFELSLCTGKYLPQLQKSRRARLACGVVSTRSRSRIVTRERPRKNMTHIKSAQYLCSGNGEPCTFPPVSPLELKLFLPRRSLYTALQRLTQKVKKNVIYYDKTQHANYRGEPPLFLKLQNNI